MCINACKRMCFFLTVFGKHEIYASSEFKPKYNLTFLKLVLSRKLLLQHHVASVLGALTGKLLDNIYCRNPAMLDFHKSHSHFYKANPILPSGRSSFCLVLQFLQSSFTVSKTANWIAISMEMIPNVMNT